MNRFEHLRRLSPVEAVKTWLDGDFGIDDEPALIEAIRKDPRIKQTDDQILDFMGDAIMEEGLDPKECLENLAQAQ